MSETTTKKKAPQEKTEQSMVNDFLLFVEQTTSLLNEDATTSRKLLPYFDTQLVTFVRNLIKNPIQQTIDLHSQLSGNIQDFISHFILFKIKDKLSMIDRIYTINNDHNIVNLMVFFKDEFNTLENRNSFAMVEYTYTLQNISKVFPLYIQCLPLSMHADLVKSTEPSKLNTLYNEQQNTKGKGK